MYEDMCSIISTSKYKLVFVENVYAAIFFVSLLKDDSNEIGL